MEENRFDKCKYCKNYDHQFRNKNYPFKCQLDKWDCYDIFEMPRYDEVEDKAYRDKEIEEYNKSREEMYKRIDRSLMFANVIYGIIAVQFILALYLSIVSTIYWFTHDNLTKMQLFKAIYAQHPILYSFLIITALIEIIVPRIFKK